MKILSLILLLEIYNVLWYLHGIKWRYEVTLRMVWGLNNNWQVYTTHQNHKPHLLLFFRQGSNVYYQWFCILDEGCFIIMRLVWRQLYASYIVCVFLYVYVNVFNVSNMWFRCKYSHPYIRWQYEAILVT